MDTFTVGIISDTHRVIREEALAILRGEWSDEQIVDEPLYIDAEPGREFPHKAVDLIVHAGDIGEGTSLSQDVIGQLESIAPVRAVLGNCDMANAGNYWTEDAEPVLDQMAVLDLCGVTFAVMHQPEDLAAAIRATGIKPRVRIHGHTHIPQLKPQAAGLFMCPGSVTKPPSGGNRPIDWQRTLGLVHLEEPGKLLRAEIIRL